MNQPTKTISFMSLILIGLFSAQAFAVQAQPVPIAEDPSAMPQINISGVGIATLGYAKNASMTSGKSAVNISDSALQIGAAQKLYEHGAVGSFGFGGVTSDETNNGSSMFLHQGFVDYQSGTFEALIGRSDNPTAHLVDFPTLRGDDLVTLTNPLNPFSKGENVEEHRYSNLASVTFNQNLKYFENFHVQHLLNSVDSNSDSGLNSFGAAFGYLGAPGMESFESFPSLGIGYESIKTKNDGLNQIYAGGTATLRKSVTNRLELGFQDLVSFGSDLRAFSSVTDTFTADSNALAASLRYLHSPFGKPGYQVALTGAYKSYMKVDGANSYGFALNAAKRLGQGFDLVAQYQGQWRGSSLAEFQSAGLGYEQIAEIGFAFNFDATFNEHIAPRRTLLNQQHHYISE